MRKILPALLAALLLAACSSVHRKGGYHQDDGPPERSRADLAAIPDAVPRREPLSPRGNQPYIVYGKTYYPLKHAIGYRERGIASWYGRKFHGKRTSSGEQYDMYGMTAAHKTLPLPTYVRVRNLNNGRSVIVRVNDRGPFVQNRLIDLSYTAAAKLGIFKTGTGIVEVEALGTRKSQSSVVSPNLGPAPTGGTARAPRLYLQVGAFTNWKNAASLQARLQHTQLGPIFIKSELHGDVHMFRVRVGPLDSVEESDRLVQQAVEYGVPDAHIVVEYPRFPHTLLRLESPQAQ